MDLAAGAKAELLLVCLVLEDPRSVALGEEPVRVAADVVGRVTSGGFGYTVGRSIAYAYLPADRAPDDRGRSDQLSAAAVPRYPEWDRFAAVRHRTDPDGRFRNTYLDRVLGLP